MNTIQKQAKLNQSSNSKAYPDKSIENSSSRKKDKEHYKK